MLVRAIIVAALLCVPSFAMGQTGTYAGQQDRPVKALSQQQIEDLRTGRGMTLALAAELNGYPGPMHVLELADRMELDDSQKAQIENLLKEMRREAIQVGTRLLAAEISLDREFAERRVTTESVVAGTQAVAALQGELRATHLRYHLATVEVLNAGQVVRYNELRGYSDSSSGGGHHRHHR